MNSETLLSFLVCFQIVAIVFIGLGHEWPGVCLFFFCVLTMSLLVVLDRNKDVQISQFEEEIKLIKQKVDNLYIAAGLNQ